MVFIKEEKNEMGIIFILVGIVLSYFIGMTAIEQLKIPIHKDLGKPFASIIIGGSIVTLIVLGFFYMIYRN